ncbi:MAG TPA: PKD domain-containing protein [Candidatus Saccharimonadales bacterium]|nr:PKD domain-containing protein [Candidatus Saccharimonadales bacterium]
MNRPFTVGRAFVGLATVATVIGTGVIALAPSAYAATTLQVSNLQSTCGSPGFNGHAQVTGAPSNADADNTVIQAQLTDPNYPDDFHGPVTLSNGAFDGTVNWTNPIGSENNPPTTATAVQFDLYDYTTSTHLATFSSTLPGCSSANSPPTANAGPDVQVYVNRAVQLDGSGSSDPNGDALAYAWSYPSGTPCTFSDTTIAKPTTTCTQTGGYTATLTVGDATHPAASSDTVTVTVQEVPPPTAADFTVAVTVSRTTPPLDVTTQATNPCGGNLTVQITKAPSFGTASVSNNKIVYTAGDQVVQDHLVYAVTDDCGHGSNLATVHYNIRYAPIFGAVATAADAHRADGKVTVRVSNPSDYSQSTGAGPDSYRVCITNTGACQLLSGVPDGQSGSLTFTGFRENTRVYYTVAIVGDPARSGSIYVFRKTTVHFTASIAKYAVKSGKYKGMAKVGLLNWYSGSAVTIYVRDGNGAWHKYYVALEKNRTVYVPTPRGKHKVYVYRYYGGRKHLVTYRYVIRYH